MSKMLGGRTSPGISALQPPLNPIPQIPNPLNPKVVFFGLRASSLMVEGLNPTPLNSKPEALKLETRNPKAKP